MHKLSREVCEANLAKKGYPPHEIDIWLAGYDFIQTDLATANATISALEVKLAAAERLLDLAKSIEFQDHSAIVWGSTNGEWKWEYSRSVRSGSFAGGSPAWIRTYGKGRFDSALEAFEALQKENTNETKSPFHDVVPVNVKAEFVGRIDPKAE